ncbi:MAG: hypothetical protein ACFCAD_12930 [Pleurocapsa sp.]
MGKSRLAYELISQIKDSSAGWLETVGNLQKAIAFKQKHYKKCREKTAELLKGTGISGDR